MWFGFLVFLVFLYLKLNCMNFKERPVKFKKIKSN